MMKIVNAVLCEDIRQEANGKFLLIGVYSDGVAFPAFPANAVLSIWLQLAGLSKGENKLDVRGRAGRREVFSASLSFEVHDPARHGTLPLGPLPVGFERACDFIVELRGDAGRWKRGLTMPVTRNT